MNTSPHPIGESVVLAIDLGGTSMKGAIVTEDGLPVLSERRSTPAEGVVEALIDFIREFEAKASRLQYTVAAAAVVTPGIVEESSGIVRYASNLGWRDVPLLDLLRAQFAYPIAVGHDVRTAGLAERLLGAARDCNEFVLVPIGTGVAAALVTRGDTVTGATGATGEFGHIPVIPDGEPCTCGQRGCLEVYASGAGVARRYAAQGGDPLTSTEIVAQLGHDPIADGIWADAVRVLAQGLTIMTLLLDPSVIVIGGGFAKAGDALLGPLRTTLGEGLAWRESPQVLLSTVGEDAGRTGAAILAFRAAGRDSVVEAWPTF